MTHHIFIHLLNNVITPFQSIANAFLWILRVMCSKTPPLTRASVPPCVGLPCSVFWRCWVNYAVMSPSWLLQGNIITKTSSTLTNSPIRAPYEPQEDDYSFLNVMTLECYVLSRLVSRSSMCCDALAAFSSRCWLQALRRTNMSQCPIQATLYFFYIGMDTCDGFILPAMLSVMYLRKQYNAILSSLDHHLFSLLDNCCNNGSVFIYCIQQIE